MTIDTSTGCANRGVAVPTRPRVRNLGRPHDRIALVFPSDLGWMAAVWHADRLNRLAFGLANRREALVATNEEKASAPGSWGRLHRGFVERMQSVAAGDADDLGDIVVDLDDRTDFQRLVLDQCRKIPRGTVRTYAELARLAGHAGAARAVGNVMATNRVPLVIPCHRVIGSGGKLGGFSAPQGLAMKVRLLEMEGARSVPTPR